MSALSQVLKHEEQDKEATVEHTKLGAKPHDSQIVTAADALTGCLCTNCTF